MCGIFGSVFDARPFDANAALARLWHRGPDSNGVFREGDVLLGHTRLAILDLTSDAAQPMKSADGTAVIVFNGEIYNHHELRRELIARGRRFRSRSDTEVIVEGYCEHGTAFLERLDGMFALAIFDLRNNKLVAARDRTGKKPLFYAFENGALRFASEMRALFATGTRTDIRLASFPMLFALGYVPPPRTLYEAIDQLPPASILEMHRGGTPRIRKYWTAPFASEPLHATTKDVIRDTRTLVENAVLRRLEADVPLGAFLSGGIDSTIVVGVMARAFGRRVKTFSIGFSDDPRFDETSYARIAAKAFDTEHTEFTVEPRAFDLLDRLVEAHDGPFGDSSAIPTAVVSMLTRKHVTVALTGDGGDELFAGYSRFLAAEAAERVPLRMRRAAHDVAKHIPAAGTRIRRVQRFLRTSALPLAERMLRWQSYFVDDLCLLFRSHLHVDVEQPVRWAHELCSETRHSSPLTQALQFNFDSYLPFDLLVKADRTSMLHSLELRSPFLDKSLIEYCARLPDSLRRRGTTTKWVLKRAFADLLPREISTRPKLGFGMPLGTWFRGRLRGFVHDTLAPTARAWDYLDRGFVDRMLLDHERGVRDLEHPIWLLLTFERWLQLLPRWRAPC